MEPFTMKQPSHMVSSRCTPLLRLMIKQMVASYAAGLTAQHRGKKHSMPLQQLRSHNEPVKGPKYPRLLDQHKALSFWLRWRWRTRALRQSYWDGIWRSCHLRSNSGKMIVKPTQIKHWDQEKQYQDGQLTVVLVWTAKTFGIMGM